MRARYRHLLDHSVGCALSAIEVYNKPDFKEREQVFAILMVAAWETLLKAKILKANRNRLKSLYIKAGSRYKKNRAGEYLTIDVLTAARQCAVNTVVQANLERMVEIRDAAVHLTADSPSLPHLVYSLGLASVRNYARLASDWFGVSIDDYNFFILPIGFAYPFQAVSPAELRREPRDVAAILKRVTRSQEDGLDEDGGFHLAFEIRTRLVSAKKLTGPADVTAAIDPSSDRALVVEKRVRPIDQYPLRFTDLWARVKASVPAVKQGEVHAVLRDCGIRGNSTYSTYNWRSKLEETRGPGATTPIIYNGEAANFVVREVCRRFGHAEPVGAE